MDAEAASITPSKSKEFAAGVREAKAAQSVQINGVNEYASGFREAVQAQSELLCRFTLWKEYCSIPFPGQADMVQTGHPEAPPEAWFKEARSRLEALLYAVGRDTCLHYLQPALGQWPLSHNRIMSGLRDMVLDQLHRGAYRGRRRQLGVLAEVLGLEAKGSQWPVATI